MRTRLLLLLLILALCYKATTQETMTLNDAKEAYFAGDYQKVVSIYKTLSEQADAAAQCNLGFCYYTRKRVEQSSTEAVKCYGKAAKQGYAEAQYSLGACYQYGQGFNRSIETAIKWYRKVAEQGYGKAIKILEQLEKN